MHDESSDELEKFGAVSGMEDMSIVQAFVHAAPPPPGLPLAGEEKRGMGRGGATTRKTTPPLAGGGWVGVLKAGMILITILPIIVLFVVLQKQVTAGFISGAVKG